MGSRVILLTVVVVAVLIGGNFTALKFALDHTSPVLLAGMRTIIGGTALLAFAFARGEKLPRTKADLANIFVVSLSITTISSGLLVAGVNRVSAGVASLVASTMPLFTALLAAVLIGAAISTRSKLGLLTGLVGTSILAWPSLGGQSTALGVITLLASAIAWAFGTVYMKWQNFDRVSPVMLVGVQLIMSAAALIPLALAVEGTRETDWSIGLFVPLLYAALPANALTFALLATVVKRATPTQAAASAYLIPVFGVFFGWSLRGDRLGVAELIGGLFVIFGVYLVVDGGQRRTVVNET